MDIRKFDEITKVLGGDASRRNLLKGAVGGGLAAILGGVSLLAAPAGVEARLRCSQPKAGVAMGGPDQNGTACTGGDPAACASGYCTSTICRECPIPCDTSAGSVCCPSGTRCKNNACRRCRRV